MRSHASASAPGKLFLFGEYSVLAGGWSLVAAVDRRARARVSVDRTGYLVTAGDTEMTDDRLPSAVTETIDATYGEAPSPTQITTDITPFYEGDNKLGLGSSAASTAAITSAALQFNVQPTQDMAREVFSIAFSAHRSFQDGQGSCADVAASCFGGLLAYRLTRPDPRFSQLDVPAPDHRSERLPEANIAKLTWPDALSVRAVWLGKPAKSVDFIDRLMDATDRSLHTTQALLGELARAGDEAFRCLRTGDVDKLLALVDRADGGLEHLGHHIGAPIVVDEHRELRDVAKNYGLRVKPSGAGGGDFSLVFGPSQANWDDFEASLGDTVVIDLGDMRVDGVRKE
jgi:phosphomevalonate kinase